MKSLWQSKPNQHAGQGSICASIICALLLLSLSASAQDEFTYSINNGAVTVTGLRQYCWGIPMEVDIPSTIGGLPVTGIGDWAFSWVSLETGQNSYHVTRVTIPPGVTRIGGNAFFYSPILSEVWMGPDVTTIGSSAFALCSNLTSIYFEGNAPNDDTSVFYGSDRVIVYYLSGTTGWGQTFGGRPTVQLNSGHWGPFLYRTNGGTITITKYIGSGGSVVIPDRIDGLAVTSVGPSAFQRCDRLASVTIPDSIVSLEGSAFDQCTSLTNVTFGTNLAILGARAFANSSLASVTIPDSMTNIGDGAFQNGGSLLHVRFGDSVATIGSSAFSYCYSLTNVTLPDPVASIGDFAFSSCWGLTSVALGKGVKSIGEAAFKSCSIINVTIPSSVTNIGSGVFSWCSRLGAIEVDTLNPAYTSADGVLFNKDKSALLQYPGGKPGSYTVPNVVNSLEDSAFEGCGQLTSVIMPSSVRAIGRRAFLGSALTGVTIPDTVTNFGDWAFGQCSSLGSVTLGSGVTSIADYAFVDCTSLTTVTIPNSVTAIGNSAFGDCTRLSTVTIPSRLTSIGEAAFNNCTSLSSVNIPNSVTNIGGAAFLSSRLTSITIPNEVLSIPGFAFYQCGSLTNATVGTRVTSLGDSAFAGCTRLISVYFNGNAPSVGSLVFDQDTNATVYYLPGTTGWSATFGGRPTVLWDLQSQFDYTTQNGEVTITGYVGSGGVVTIPSTINGLPVTRIGDSVFSGRGDVTSITIPGTITSIGSSAFSYCTNLTTSIIPNSITNIAQEAFSFCSKLTSLTIGNGLTSIAESAFSSCTSLTGVFFHGNAPSLGLSVFTNDTNAIVYYLPGTTGWGPTFGGRPTALWNPTIQASGPGFGVGTKGFGFLITGTMNIPVVIEACTNLVNPSWSPIAAETLTAGSAYFSDPDWTNYSARFYRMRSP